MLREHKSVKQHQGEHFRRWFGDEYFDLIVWYDSNNEIFSFQLCYDTSGDEHVVTWQNNRGFSHNRIDGGEPSPLKNMAPIVVPDGIFPFDYVMKRFKENSKEIDSKVARFIIKKLLEYSESLKDI